MQSKESTIEMLRALDKKYGMVATFLNHETPFQLLIAVILSAQTTDAMVNKVTPNLFAEYPDAAQLKTAPLTSVETIIHRINYYRTKAKNIIETARIIDEEFNGKIPDKISDLIKLKGVGRKVANVILSEIFEIPEGIVVDTHVKRVSKRVGWTKSEYPEKIEQDLMKSFPQDHWITSSKQLILIGRQYCFPKNPNCNECPLNLWCEKNINPNNISDKKVRIKPKI